MDFWIGFEGVFRLFASGPPQQFFCVSLGLPGIDNPSLYHPGFSLHFLTGVLRPFRMDSLMPGMDKRYNVSRIDRQSSSEIKIAFDLLPVI